MNTRPLLYNRKLKSRAQKLRRNMTNAERKLWYEVLARNEFKNFRFLRQKPIDNYIVDFYCSELKLAIEVDGGQHAINKEYDEIRTSILNSYGIKVIRYWNNEIINNLPEVYEDLIRKIRNKDW